MPITPSGGLCRVPTAMGHHTSSRMRPYQGQSRLKTLQRPSERPVKSVFAAAGTWLSWNFSSQWIGLLMGFLSQPPKCLSGPPPQAFPVATWSEGCAVNGWGCLCPVLCRVSSWVPSFLSSTTTTTKRGKQTTTNPNNFHPVLRLSSTFSAPVTSSCVISRVLWRRSDFDASNWQKHIKGDLSNSSPKSKQIRIRLLKNRRQVTETELIQWESSLVFSTQDPKSNSFG